jgi:5-methylcytosine-specific restriction enzyme A
LILVSPTIVELETDARTATISGNIPTSWRWRRMANVLYYWRPDNYALDRRYGFGYHLNQNSPALASMAPGETLWAFTRDRFGRYSLAAELVVKAVTRNPPNYRYGRHRVWGDLERTRYFDIEVAPNAEPLLRDLEITANAAILAQSFQGHRAVKELSETDHRLLVEFTRKLAVLEKARIYPEDEFEARLLLGSDAGRAVVREAAAEYAVRSRYLFETVDVRRARRHAEKLQGAYGGRCQICRFDPRDRYGRNLCHGHHVQWLSRGGEDALENLVLICPNHHSAVHRDDAVFDYADLAFRFSNGLIESLQINLHLQRAS